MAPDASRSEIHSCQRQSNSVDDDGRPKRTGTLWTASAHIVTVVIGSGVLSLAWTMSKLGWVAGPIVFLAFAVITGFMSMLLADCYRTSSGFGTISKRNCTYMDAVRSTLGELQTKLCATSQYSALIGAAIGYTITASIGMVSISRANCLHAHGDGSMCHIATYPFVIAFGLVQIVLSQIPNLGAVWWLSILAAVMSFSYSSISIGLSIVKIYDSAMHSSTTIGSGYSNGYSMNDVWVILQAIGNIAFAYSYTPILIEIQDTIRSPPDETKTMKKASFIGVSVTTIFYMLCGCVGYAAFGSDAPGNILTGVGLKPYWLVDVANAFVVIHLVGAFQVFVQPVYGFFEHQYPRFANVDYAKDFLGFHLRVNVFRIVVRSTFVILITLISIVFPFFNDVLGIIGALVFWPLTVYFPIQMYKSKRHIKRWTMKWCALQVLVILCLIISLGVLVASMRSLILNVSKYRPFH